MALATLEFQDNTLDSIMLPPYAVGRRGDRGSGHSSNINIFPKSRRMKISDGLIHANRFANSRALLDSRKSPGGSQTEPPLFANRASGRKKIANRRFEAICANRSDVMNISFFLRIDSRKSSRFALRIAGPSTWKISGKKERTNLGAIFPSTSTS